MSRLSGTLVVGLGCVLLLGGGCGDSGGGGATVDEDFCAELGLAYRETPSGEGYCYKQATGEVDEAFCAALDLEYGETDEGEGYCFSAEGIPIDEAFCAQLGLQYQETDAGSGYCYRDDTVIIDEDFCENLGLEYRENGDGEGYCYDKSLEVDCAEYDDGTPCDDGDACTQADACAGDDCVGEVLPGIDDDNPCTEDSCDPATGEITNDPAPRNGNACDDEDVCSNNDQCADGRCVGDYTVDGNGDPIDDGDDCTADSCDASGIRQNVAYTAETAAAAGLIELADLANACLAYVCELGAGDSPHMESLDGTPCDDPDQGRTNGVCVTWTCRTGQCAAMVSEEGVATAPVTGGQDLHPACRMRECNTSTGEVEFVIDPDRVGVACNDDNVCTFADSCTDAGECTGLELAHGTECDDDDPCTVGDYCHEGECRSGDDELAATRERDPAGLVAGGVECREYVCDATRGVIIAAVADGTDCDDGNPCTATSGCQGGECVGARTATNDGDVCPHPETECLEGYCDKGVCLNFQGVTDGRACAGTNECRTHQCGIDAELGQCIESGYVADGTVCGELNDGCLDQICAGGQCLADTDLAKHEGEACGAFDDRCNDPRCDANGLCVPNPLAGAPACDLVAEDLLPPLVPLDLPCNLGSCQDVGGIGVCTPVAAAEAEACDNANPCDGADWCQAGRCVEQHPTDNPGDASYDNLAPTATESTPCEVDGDPRTVGRCRYDGACVEIDQVADDTNPCTLPFWDEANGQLEYADLPTGTPCHQVPVNPCVENRGVCIDGECHVNLLPDGTPCDLAGQAVAPLEDLPDGHQPLCYAEVCIAGACVIDTSLRDGLPCPDGEMTCTAHGTCADGACTPSTEPRGYGETCSPPAPTGLVDLQGQPVDDVDAQCWAAFECAEDGTCSVAAAPLPNSTPCDANGDGDTCDGRCVAGACQAHLWAAGANASCDDDEVCTIDACDGAGACQHTAQPDGPLPVLCEGLDPDNACANLQCAAGVCLSVGNDANPCSDDNPCTVDDHCADGACVATTPAAAGTECDFDFADTDCTRNVCGPTGECNQPAAEPDGSPCRTEELCSTWQCVAGTCEELATLPDGTNCDTNDVPCDEGCLDVDGPDGAAASACLPFADFLGLLTASEMAANGHANRADDPEEAACRALYDPTYDSEAASGGHGCLRFVCYYGDCRPWRDTLAADAGLADNPTEDAACTDAGACTAEGVCRNNACDSYHHREDGTACGVATCGDLGEVRQPTCKAGACSVEAALVDACDKGVSTCQASDCHGGACSYDCVPTTVDYLNAFEDISGAGGGTPRRDALRSPGDLEVTCGDIDTPEVTEWERLACDDGSVILDLQDDLGFVSPDGDGEGFWFYNRRYRYISISVNGTVLLHRDHPLNLADPTAETLFVMGNVGGESFDPDAGDAPGDPVNNGEDAAQLRVFRDDLTFITDVTVPQSEIPGTPTIDYGSFTRFGELYTKHLPGPDGALEDGSQGNYDDYLIVQWHDAAFFGCAGAADRSRMTFQLKWWPATGRLVFVYPEGRNDDGLGSGPYCLPDRTHGLDASIGLFDENAAPADEVGADAWLITHTSGPEADAFDDYYLFWPTDKPTGHYAWRGQEWFDDIAEFDPGIGTTRGHALAEVSNCDHCCELVALDPPVFVDGQPRSAMNVCSDGYVDFSDFAPGGGGESVDCGAATMLDDAAPVFHAAPFWSDLRLDEGPHSGVFWLDDDRGGERVIIVQWHRADYDVQTGRAGLPLQDQERGEPLCSDDDDDDGDGLVDCDDASCHCAAACGGPGCGLSFQLVLHAGRGDLEFRYLDPAAEFAHAIDCSTGTAIGFQQAVGGLAGVDLLDGRDGGAEIVPGLTLDPADTDEQAPRQQLNVLLGVNGYLQPYHLLLP